MFICIVPKSQWLWKTSPQKGACIFKHVLHKCRSINQIWASCSGGLGQPDSCSSTNSPTISQPTSIHWLSTFFRASATVDTIILMFRFWHCHIINITCTMSHSETLPSVRSPNPGFRAPVPFYRETKNFFLKLNIILTDRPNFLGCIECIPGTMI